MGRRQVAEGGRDASQSGWGFQFLRSHAISKLDWKPNPPANLVRRPYNRPVEAWGGRSTDFYEHPFHAQPRCYVYSKLNRKTTDDRNTQGYSAETRTRALDTMPFGSSLQLDMEVRSGTDCDMGYGVGTNGTLVPTGYSLNKTVEMRKGRMVH